jgi:uncharacterized protein involved in response to NO
MPVPAARSHPEINLRRENAARAGIPRGIARQGPAILSYGFRPFFLGAGVWAMLAMILWTGAIAAGWPIGGAYGAIHWHAHEMLFGYAGAALAGFMLTAIPNWTGRLPVSGTPLLVLVMLWLAGRLALLTPGEAALWPAIAVDLAFFPLLAAIAAREIGAGHNWKNLHVVAGLGLLTIANGWFHWAVIGGGDTGPAYRLAITVWLLLISLIGGRLAVSFTRNWLARKGDTRLPASFGRFDRIVLLFGLGAFGLWIAMPESPWTGVLAGTAAILHALRLGRWRGFAAWREPLVLVLHAAYGFLPLGLAAISAAAFGLIGPVTGLHVLTVGAIGTMTLAVMTRATRGHTGNPLTASPVTTLAYSALIAAAIMRFAVDFAPDAYLMVLTTSALLWLLAFGLFLAEYAPMLIRPRRQGR